MIACDISAWSKAPATASRPIFAIGDVHGCADLLAALHERIRAIVAEDRLSAALVVHLGDYIDRGPQPLACLRCALRGGGLRDAGIESVSLPGNHEQYLWRALTEEPLEPVLETWLGFNGGAAVAREIGYGEAGAIFGDPVGFVAALRRHLGAELIGQLAALPRFLRQDRYLFVHAGIDPGRSLDQQLAPSWQHFDRATAERDPLWIRGPFLDHSGPYPEDVIVVHGHTIGAAPVIRTNRICVDTGAFMSSRLTAVELRGDAGRFITAIGSPGDWVARL